MNGPTLTILDEWGHVRSDMPNPPANHYPAAPEVFTNMAACLNRIADLRQRLSQSDTIKCTEALQILDNT